MKEIIMNRSNVWIPASILLAIILFSQMSLFSPQAAAQDPTPVPTATTAPTWTPVPGTTVTPTAGVPVAPTPPGSNPTATPTGRLVDFRVDSDEIEPGECVVFSWIVRGDVAWIEFEQDDDDKDPILVDDQGDRQECPAVETDYELLVTWLDHSTTSRRIEIKVNSDESSDGSGGSASGGAAVPTPGPFVVVTPIALAEILEATEVADSFNNSNPAGGGSAPPSDHILATIVELPETGGLPGHDIMQKSSPATATFWLPLMGALMLGCGAVALLFRSSRR